MADRTEYMHAYYLAHREEKIEAGKQRYRENKDRRKAIAHEWYQRKKMERARERNAV